MPNPTAGSLHVDGLLTDFSVGFVQGSDKFVADKVFPLVPVMKRSDRYAIYNQSDFQRDDVAVRESGAPAARVGYRTDHTNTYYCSEFALEFAVGDDVRANQDGPYNVDEDAVKYLAQKMLIRRELDFVTKFMSTQEIWDGSSDGQNLISGTDYTAWSNAASTPIEDILKEQSLVEQKTGFLPNKLVLNRQVWNDLMQHPDIVDRVKHTSDAPISQGIVARLMGLDEILVAAAISSTNAEGMTNAGSYIVKDNALLVYAPSSPGLMTPSGGYTFAWNGLLAGANYGQVIERYREDKVVADVFRIRAAWDQKVITAACGVLFENASTRI
jgi:hypothetical protein